MKIINLRLMFLDTADTGEKRFNTYFTDVHFKFLFFGPIHSISNPSKS